MARETMTDVKAQRDDALAELAVLRAKLAHLETLLDTVLSILQRARGG
jgi:hypothetical protein